MNQAVERLMFIYADIYVLAKQREKQELFKVSRTGGTDIGCSDSCFWTVVLRCGYMRIYMSWPERESVGMRFLRFDGREERHGLLGQLFLGCSFEGLLYADRYVLAKEKGKAV